VCYYDRTIGQRRHRAGIAVQVAPIVGDSTALFELRWGRGAQLDADLIALAAGKGAKVARGARGATAAAAADAFEVDGEASPMPLKVAAWIRHAITASLQRGPVLGYPVVGVSVTVHSWDLGSGGGGGGGGGGAAEDDAAQTCTETAMAGCTSMAFLSAIRDSAPRLLEPVMRVSIALPADHVGPVVSDISHRRRGEVALVSGEGGRWREITATVPLREMVGYATSLRSIASGEASFEMAFERFGPLTASAQAAVVTEIRGF
jgi:elongation factor G